MAAPLNPGKKTVELHGAAKPSRIRRDPVHVKEVEAEAAHKLHWRSSEREIWLALLGIAFFAVSIDIIAVAISVYWD
jgi:hypothetical protein